MANTNIINAVFGSGICAVTTSAYRANYGMVLRFSGIDLPTAFEVDFSNYDVAGRDSVTAIGQNNKVQIPDDLWDSGLNIYAYVYLHPTDDSGVTVYTVTIPVLGRPNRTEETPTPHEQTVIEQAISALNDAVEQTAADVETTTANAQAAAQSEANASVSERSAAASASAALASQNAAESAAQSATESASASAESARNAAQSASQAAQSATSAQASAEQAERSVQSITDDVERAERAAATATGKATEAASSAATASTKAAQAEQSATAAAQSASSASTAAQNAAESEQSAESHATDAETAKQGAQTAQTAAEAAQAAAEQAAESVSGLSAQIEQNTADIADFVQTKAGALVDTVSGSIASFVPDSTVPTVKGLTVNVEPMQDLHGYDSPWPSGGGKNLLNANLFVRTSPTAGNDLAVNNETITMSWVNGGVVGNNKDKQTIKAGTYTISATGTNTGFAYARIDSVSAGTITTASLGASKTFTADDDFYVSLYGDYNNHGTAVFKLQIELGSTATAYAPYSNICPISGWDAVEVKHSGADMTNPTTYTIQLGQTVYGGTIDVTNGVLTVDRAMVDLGTLNWSYSSGSTFNMRSSTNIGALPPATVSSVPNAISSIYPVLSYLDVNATDKSLTIIFATSGQAGTVWVHDSSYTDAATFKAAMSGVQLVYELATPITIPLTPLEISVLTGQTNNVWADSGDVSVEYAADLKTYINQKIAAAVAALS